MGIEHWFEIAIILERSKKTVAFVDVPLGHPLADERRTVAMLERALASTHDLAYKIEIMKQTLPILAEITSERNAFMLEEIPKKMRKLLDTDKRLRRKQKVKVLLSLGASHTPLFIHLKNLDTQYKVERSFDKSSEEEELSHSFIFDYYDRPIGELQFKGTLDHVSDEEIARAILTRDCTVHFFKSVRQNIEFRPTKDIFGDFRRYISMFSLEDIKKVYVEVEKGRKFSEVFLESLKGKGIENKFLES